VNLRVASNCWEKTPCYIEGEHKRGSQWIEAPQGLELKRQKNWLEILNDVSRGVLTHKCVAGPTGDVKSEPSIRCVECPR